MNTIRPLFAAAAGIATALTVAAAAPVSAAPTSVSVRYADLDLTHVAGRAVLDRRINRAVNQVCEVGAARDLPTMMSASNCRRESLQRARNSAAAKTAQLALR